jgi:hypothetical protein
METRVTVVQTQRVVMNERGSWTFLDILDHAPICIETDMDITSEVAVSAEECGVTVVTWETFDNTCYIQAVTESLQQLDHFMAWCSDNSVPYIHDLLDVHSANFPETLNKYIMWLWQSGLQR